MREAKNTIVKPTWICEVVTSTKQKMSHTGLKSDLVFYCIDPPSPCAQIISESPYPFNLIVL